jgi:prolycopene isomerase
MATGFLPESADCVIVGGGMAGFAAGLQLELWGYKPLILERHNLPGGLATSFVRGKFEFEGTLHEMMDVGSPEHPGKMREFFEEAGVEVDWHQVKEAYRIVVPSEGIDARLPWGIEAMVEEIERQVPGSRESVGRLMAACKDVLDSINTPGFTELSKPALLLRHSTFVRTAGYSAAEVIRRFGVPPKAVSLLAPYWIYVGSPLSELSFTVYAYLMADYFVYGAVTARGNSFALSLALEKRFRELGGRVEYNSPVEKILVKEGRVTGVRTARGETVRTTEVISGAYPNAVYSSMIEPASEVPVEAVKLTNSRRIGVSAFTVYLALDGSPEELGLPDYNTFVATKTMDTDELWRANHTLGAPEYLTAIVLNHTAPECFPAGKTELSITCLPKPEAWYGVKAADYAAQKRAWAASMIETMSSVWKVDLRSRIEELEIAAPMTVARYTGSWNGSVYGYEHITWDSIVARLSSERRERWIEGLEFAGAHASVGNGYAPQFTNGRKAALEARRALAARGGAAKGKTL